MALKVVTLTDSSGASDEKSVNTRIILCMRQANERRCYNVTLPLISRAHIKSDHCNMKTFPFQWTDLSFYDTKLQPKKQQETVVLWVYFLCGHFSMIGEWQFLAVRLKFNLGEIICCQQKRQINHTISPSYTLDLWTHKQEKKKISSQMIKHQAQAHNDLTSKAYGKIGDNLICWRSFFNRILLL